MNMATKLKTYERFDAATRGIDAYAIAFKGEIIGRVVFKHGNTCRCFAQVWNTGMGEGIARGHGFDRSTEAFEHALIKIRYDAEKDDPKACMHVRRWRELFQGKQASAERWDNRLLS